MIIEIIGILATILILASMSFKTTSIKWSLWMRALNIAGSVVFVVYGLLLPAYSTAILNAVLVFVNTYHLIILLKERKQKTQAEQNTNTETK